MWNDLAPVAPSAPNAPCQTFFNPLTGLLTAREATGGRIQDICASDWSPLFDWVAQQATELRDFFPLRTRPDLFGTPPLELSVAGQVVAQYPTDGGQAVWNWESEASAIVFAPNFAPSTTQPVTINYPVACMP